MVRLAQLMAMGGGAGPRSFAAFAALVAIGLSPGCGSPAPAPIYDRSANPYERAAASASPSNRPSYYQIREGDTLYGIAWRYGLDYRELAAWNEIDAPYLIRPGLRLSLIAPPASSSPPASERSAGQSQARTAAVKPPPRPAAPTPVTAEPPAGKRSPPAVVTVAPPPKVTESVASTGGAIRWQWPASGTIIGRFGDAGQGGIDIGGKPGQQILAAADGEVVYSGVGLVGYGELIIIKHDDEYLSAYAHNRRRLVSEGQRVAKGGRIAEMGDSGTDRPKLHFEIRKGGKPMDPLRYLPSR